VPVARAGSEPVDWASSVDLHVEVAPRGERRASLERGVRAAIRSGRLRPGDRLPSSRALAADLGLARGTVAEAYAQLAAEGYLTARPGAPTRVAAGLVAVGPGERGATAPPGGALSAGTPPADAGPRLDLRAGSPDVGAFPRAVWLRALRRVLATAPDRALGHGDPRGRPELRLALAAYLGRTRGVLADPERIVVCAGFTEGLALLSGALGARSLAMEDPCVDHHRGIVARAGLEVVPMPVDERGAIPVAAGAALVTPAHQFPLGATLAPERRAAFVAAARAGGTVVIEDDYDGEFRYDRQPAGALQGLDPEHVAYAGTASKTLAPALRLGWLVLPARLVEPVVAAKRLAGDTPAVEQLALAELLGSGAYDRHVRRMRQRYRRRRDLLLARLGSRRTHGIAAGLHLVVDAGDEAAVVEAAARRSLALHGLGMFWHSPAGRPGGLVIGYAAPPEHEYGASLDALMGALRE
jgi:GntR family transcriptional regulator/MocR family aminotransferase